MMAHGETLGLENNRVVEEIGRVPCEVTFRGKRVDSAQRMIVEQHENFHRLVIEFRGQPAQVCLDVSEVKSVEKWQQTPCQMRVLPDVEQGKASDVSRKLQRRDQLAPHGVEGYESVFDCLL